MDRVELARKLLKVARIGPALSSAGLTDAVVAAGKAEGWLEIRGGQVTLTATGQDALRTDWRTDAEKAADRAARERLAAGIERELDGIVNLISRGLSVEDAAFVRSSCARRFRRSRRGKA